MADFRVDKSRNKMNFEHPILERKSEYERVQILLLFFLYLNASHYL